MTGSDTSDTNLYLAQGSRSLSRTRQPLFISHKAAALYLAQGSR
jgi:hypothetical protein